MTGGVVRIFTLLSLALLMSVPAHSRDWFLPPDLLRLSGAALPDLRVHSGPTLRALPRQRTQLLMDLGGSGRVAIARLRTWIRAVQRHEPGALDVYARTITTWSYDDLAGALRDFWNLRSTLVRRGTSARVPGWDGSVDEALAALDLSPADAGGDEIVKRAAILHTDVATSASVSARRLDSSTTTPVAGGNFSAAATCVEMLRRDLPGDPFARQWYLSVAAFLQWRHEVALAPRLLEGALSLFPGDADLLMIAGCVHEYLASPRVQDAVDLPLDVPGSAADHLRRAEKAYRELVAQGARRAERALRLGRVVGQLGRPEEALSYLKPALEIPADRVIRYLTYLAIGQAEEALDHEAAAREAYLRAQALFPSAPSAFLALGHLARRADDRFRAQGITRQMLALGEGRIDPWIDYFEAGHRLLADQLLFELRKPFRKAGAQ